MLVVGISVLLAGVWSVVKRAPTVGTVGATADPHAEDPIAAALGADLPTWRTDASAPSSVLPPRVDDDAPPPPPAETSGAHGMGPADPADRD